MSKNVIMQGGLLSRLLLFGLAMLLTGCDGAAKKAETESATLLLPPKEIVDFELVNFKQGKFDNASLDGKWSLFFFGYARCPDVCPTELYMLSQVIGRIEKEPSLVKQMPQVVFVSVDPQQDKPQALQEYSQFYHPSFLGVTAEQPTIDQLTRSMGAFYQRVYHLNGQVLGLFSDGDVPEGLEDSYLINHSATIFLVNPEGELHAVFSAPHQTDVVIRDLAVIQEAW